jgi:hypothetical protein
MITTWNTADQIKLQIHEWCISMLIKSASHIKLLSCPEDVLHQNTFNTWHAVFAFCTAFLCRCSFNYFWVQFLCITWYYSEAQRIEHGSQQGRSLSEVTVLPTQTYFSSHQLQPVHSHWSSLLLDIYRGPQNGLYQAAGSCPMAPQRVTWNKKQTMNFWGKKLTVHTMV